MITRIYTRYRFKISIIISAESKGVSPLIANFAFDTGTPALLVTEQHVRRRGPVIGRVKVVTYRAEESCSADLERLDQHNVKLTVVRNLAVRADTVRKRFLLGRKYAEPCDETNDIAAVTVSHHPVPITPPQPKRISGYKDG